MAIVAPITTTGLISWEYKEWATYAHTVAAGKPSLFLEARVGCRDYRVGRKSPTGEVEYLYQGARGDEAVRIWNENRHHSS